MRKRKKAESVASAASRTSKHLRPSGLPIKSGSKKTKIRLRVKGKYPGIEMKIRLRVKGKYPGIDYSIGTLPVVAIS